MTPFEEIYSLYFKDVYLYTYSLSKNKQIAEDVTAETFLKALKSLDTYRGESDIKVWLFQIAKHHYFSYLRKQTNQKSIELTNDIKDDVNIEQMFATTEEAMRVHKVLHHISEPYREVFTLRVFGQLSFKQIAELFGKTDNWACVTFHRARSKIKDEMRGKDERKL